MHGETEYETARKKNDISDKRNKDRGNKTNKSSGNVRKRNKVKAVSTQQQELNKAYFNVCNEIGNERERICTGCGRHEGGEVRLSHSHIISRQECRNIGRVDLIADKNNIVYHCMDFGNHKGCHNNWENPDKRSMLLDYERNMEYIKSVSIELYNKYKN